MDNGGYIKRPTLLHFEHIKHYPSCHEAFNFIREISIVWKKNSKMGLVSEGHLQDLFYQLNLNPTKEQIGEMLRNAKLNSSNVRFCNGLSFGEFTVLAADFRKFSSRTNQNGQQPFHITSLSPKNTLRIKKQIFIDQATTSTGIISSTTTTTTTASTSSEMTTQTLSNNSSEEAKVEVFLGGSCNPTTWRADVAIPELQKLGISFYNPQVLEWTPQLMKLEHQAKQKAKVLFFVIDSVTRASAGAIEVAHLAAQDQQKHLILVFHPYKRKQEISHEKISEEEYLDLSRNQKLLKQLVTRRGIPVLSNIQLGLQKIKNILAGEEGPINDVSFSQSVLGSRLISVRRSFDRVVNNENSSLTLKQCSQQLLSLGYRKDLVSCDNLKRILSWVREVNSHHDESSTTNLIESSSEAAAASSSKLNLPLDEKNWDVSTLISFEEFCVISSYLSVLQQEIEENCCVSPIKGTNLPPPPIFLSNTPEVLNQYIKQCSQIEENEFSSYHNPPQTSQQPEHRHGLNRSFTIHESSSSSSKSASNTSTIINNGEHRHGIVMISTSSSSSSSTQGPLSDSSRDSGVDYRDSGTSSPQPNENGSKLALLNDIVSHSTAKAANDDDEFNEDSDSNDSVFSTSSSLDEDSNLEVRDIYLGGSCMLRTNWRRDIAIPLLKSRNISFYLPTIHENLILKGGVEKSRAYKLEELNSSSSESLMYSPRVLDSSRVLLFVITNETRSLAPMTLAAHYIGLAYNVVLCIQMLHDDCKIGNEKLTPLAIKDYNRGRTYLKDLAERQNIPVYSEITKAIECAIEKVKSSKPRCSV